MTTLLFLFTFLFGTAEAADTLHGPMTVESNVLDGTRVFDAQMRPMTPDKIARAVGDWHTAERYRRSYRLHKTASICLWVWGGVGVVGGFYLAYFSGVMGLTTGDERMLALTAAGLTFMASGVVSLPMGFVWFFSGKKKLNDPLSWWRITELEQMVDDHNAGAQPSGRRIEITPVVTPRSLALAVRF